MPGAAARVRKLVKQLEKAEGIDQLPHHLKLVTQTEDLFMRRVCRGASQRGSRVTLYRHGWPDFMIAEGQRVYCVEVKKDRKDRLRKTQKLMFPALERLGLRVFVWSPRDPDKLIPWQEW